MKISLGHRHFYLEREKIPNYFYLLATVIILVALPLTVYLAQQAQRVRIEAEEEATLVLEPSSGTLYVNQPFDVNIILNTGDYLVDGVDVILNYDPSALEATSLERGNIAEVKSYPLQEIEVDGNGQPTGRVLLSGNIGSDPVKIPIQGQDLLFGTVTFKPIKAVSQTIVSFDFTLGEPNDSNIVKFLEFTDILTQVIDATFTIEESEGATLSLSPVADTFYVGEEYRVEILLSTGEYNVDSVDVIINYDPSILEVQDADPDTAGVQIAEGTIAEFTSYPINSVDSNTGKIEFSANVEATASPQPVSGTNLPLATITFKPLQAVLNTAVTFEFTPGERNDCNVVKYMEYTDVLGQVINGLYITSVRPTPTPTPSPVPTASLDLTISLQSRTYAGVSNARSTTIIIRGTDVQGNPVDTTAAVTTNSTGNASITDLVAGTYNIFVKPEGFLQRKFADQNLVGGTHTLETVIYLAGDLDGSGKVNALDYNIFLLNFKTAQELSDLDGSGQVNSLDFSPMLSSWNQEDET